jgi:cytochrome c-type biogenesis protein CcmH/NrfF
VLRFGLFALLFAGLMVADIVWWLSAIFATVIAFVVSYIFLGRQRDELSDDLKARLARKGAAEDDAQSEDSAWDSPGDSNTKK